MTERKRRLYRVVIVSAPEGPVPRLEWKPDWEGNRETRAADFSRHLSSDYMSHVVIDPYDYDTERLPPLLITFKVGQTRSSHLRGIAEKRADWYRAHGCTVRIDESEPIVWIEGEVA